MNKPTVQEEAQEAEEPRKLNMEEKRKLEKLLIADIDSATDRYEAIVQAERQALYERLVTTPITEVRTLYQRFQVAKKQGEDLKKKLRELGYDVSYGELTVASYDLKPKQVTEFDAQADEKKRALATLKRSYVVRLFADHADTQSLFGALAKDLERLVG